MSKLLLERTRQALTDRDLDLAQDLARLATERAPQDSVAWRMLGLVMQETGQTLGAFNAYERALRLDPDDVQVALALSFSAARLGMKEEALSLASHYVQARPGDLVGVTALVKALLALDKIVQAHDLAVTALTQNPQDAGLWHLAGLTARASGALDQALQALIEAQNLRPDDPRILYDLAWTQADLGQLQTALPVITRALGLDANAETRAALGFLQATVLLATGNLSAGWQGYSARHDLALTNAAAYDLGDLPRWDGASALRGRRVVVMAEQGLGDEIAFLGLVPDLLKQLGSEGHLVVCADGRLGGLIARSWPQVTALGHQTQERMGRRHRWPSEPVDGDIWLPLGDVLALLRPSLSDFAQTAGYLKPCPHRIAHWRDWLASLGGGIKAGAAWRSHKMSQERDRNFAPLSAWAPIFAQGNVQFVSLQYGDTKNERDQIAAQFGVIMHQPPNLDLFNDLEGLAALAAALDLGIGFSNASTNLLGSVGTPLHLIGPPASWPALGASDYPWYPNAKIHLAQTHGDWAEAMNAAAQALVAKPN